MVQTCGHDRARDAARTSDDRPPAARNRRDLGAVAVVLLGAAVALVVVGFVVSLVRDAPLPVPFFLAGALALPVTVAALVTGVAAAVTDRGRWKGVAAVVASLPVGAVAVALSLTLRLVLDGTL